MTPITHQIEPLAGLVLCVLTIYVGIWLTERVRFLKENYIPTVFDLGGHEDSILMHDR